MLILLTDARGNTYRVRADRIEAVIPEEPGMVTVVLFTGRTITVQGTVETMAAYVARNLP